MWIRWLSMRRILVLDDEESVRLLLRTALEEEGYEVLEASNADSALASFEDRPTDCLITDVFMPEPDTHAKILQLIRRHPDAKLIAITGAASHDTAVAVAKLLGARQLLQKPFSMEDFRRIVRDELSS